jgi:PAS domain S-box-containing protein
MVFLVGDDGDRIGGVAVIRDNTERRKAEIEVSKTKDYLENIFMTSADGIIITDSKGRIMSVNKAVEKIFDCSSDQLVGKHFNEMRFERERLREEGLALMDELMNKGTIAGVERTWKKLDGTPVIIEMNIALLKDNGGSLTGSVAGIRDITIRKQTEEKLRDSEEQARALLNVPFDVVLLLDKSGTTLDCNKAYAERFNKSTDELKGTCCWDLFPPEVVQRRKKVVERVFQTGKPIRVVDEREGRFLDNVTYPIFDKEGKATKVAVFSRDITEQKQAEQELKQSEEKYQSLIKHANDAIVSLNQTGKIIGFNKKAEEMFGYSREEIIGKPSYLLISQQTQKKYKEALKQFQKTGTGIDRENNILEGRGMRKKGKEFPVEYSYYTIDIEGEVIATAIIRDITTRKKEEEKTINYQQQLKSLTSELILAEQKERQHFADFLHDEVGQQLFATRLQLEQLKDSLSSPENIKTLDNALNNLYQVMNQTRSLTSELSSPILKQLGLEKALEWLAEQTHKKYDILVTFEDDKEEKPLDDNTKLLLYQSVSELFTNIAKHAQTKSASISIKRDASNVQICVEDSGVGFLIPNGASSDANLAGGIGLFRIKERLEPLGGQLNIKSQPNRGTQVILIAPLKNTT